MSFGGWGRGWEGRRPRWGGVVLRWKVRGEAGVEEGIYVDDLKERREAWKEIKGLRKEGKGCWKEVWEGSDKQHK